MGDLKNKVLKLIMGDADREAVSAKPEAPVMADLIRVGTALRDTRVQAGLELRDVATMLKIRFAFMEAIEDGRYQELPGTAYAVGFVRTYAEYLGLDTDVVVRRFKDEVAGKVGQQSLYFPTPVPEGRVPGGAVLLVSLLLAAIVYGGWYVLTATDRTIVDVVPALPQRLVSLLGPVSAHNPPLPPAPPGSARAPEVTPLVAPPASAPGSSGSGSGSAPAPAAAAPSSGAPAPASAVPSAAVGAAPPAAPAMPAVAPTAMTLPPAAAPVSAAPVSAADADAGDEVPLVSGPSDENSGGPGPLMPMAPRTKPVPPVPPVTAPALAPLVTPGTSADPAVPPSADSNGGTGLVGAKPPSAPALGAVAPALPPPSGRVFGNQGRESRVQIRATQDTWVQIKEANGEEVFRKVLHTGDVYRVPDHPGIRLRTGNGGGLLMSVDNGEPTALGQVGEVLRDVPVDGSTVKRLSRP